MTKPLDLKGRLRQRGKGLWLGLLNYFSKSWSTPVKIIRVKTIRLDIVLRNTVMPAILIEGGFCDSKRDMSLFDAEKMADAIVRGLV
ncbi:hypothetical protein [Calothrix rhizosoleniae]|uniref:hypothetical protein n=1 Tax=Calothrix rhizosoleniae TaxID=888997 RepID=UPI002E0E0930